MKRLILLILISLLICKIRAEWKILTPVPHILSDVFFVDQNHGYLAGSDGSIFSTTDAGSTWHPQNSRTYQWMVSVHFMDASTGIIVGNTGTILKTTDAGNNWNSKTGPTNYYLSCVSFCDQLNGYITGEKGLIMRTANAGETWVIKNTGINATLRSCAAIFPWLCYAAGENGIILKTTTGGTSWTTLTSGTRNELYGVSFLNSSTGMAVGTGGVILKTTNGGNTWITQNTGQYTLRDVYMINANQAVACGEGGKILRTEDGGAHWIIQFTGTEEMINSIFFTDALYGAAAGTGGLVLKTTNGGYQNKPIVKISYPYQGSCFDECSDVPSGWFFNSSGTAAAVPGTDVVSVQVKLDSEPWRNVSGPLNDWTHPIDLSKLPYPYKWHTIYARAGDNLNRWSDVDSEKFFIRSSFPHYRIEMQARSGNKRDSIMAARGTEFWLDIDVDNEEDNNLFYLSFELFYTHPELIDYVSYEVPERYDSTAVSTIVPEPSKGKISAAIYNDPNLSDGYWLYSTILRLKFKVKNNAEPGKYVVFYFKNEFHQTGTVYPVVGLFSRMFVNETIIQWPGDANNNGKVEITDINSIVNNWNKTGSSLPGMISWQGYPRKVWYNYPQATFSDCDGNGLVNIKDIDAVITYLGYEHSVVNENAEYTSEENPPLSVSGGSQNSVGQEISYDLYLGSEEKPVNNFRVLSFEMQFNNQALEYLGNEKGLFLSDAGTLIIPEQEKGKVNVSVYKTESAGSGYGNFMKIKFRVKDNKPVRLEFHNILANRKDGSVQPLSIKNFNSSVDVKTPETIPLGYNLYQNYPNPFNPITNISFDIPVESEVSLKLYDVLGNEMMTLLNEFKPAGKYKVQFDGTSLSSGIYFYKIKAGDFSSTKKLILMK